MPYTSGHEIRPNGLVARLVAWVKARRQAKNTAAQPGRGEGGDAPGTYGD